MKSAVAFGAVALLLGCLCRSVLAQDILPVPVIVTPVPASAPVVPPPPELGKLWGGESESSYQVTGQVGVGVYFAHGNAGLPSTMFGTSASVGVFNERGTGVTLGYEEFSGSATKSGVWGLSHRP